MSLSVIRSGLMAGFLLARVAGAQDAGTVLSSSVGYNTLRLSLKLTAEQAKEAARLGDEASKAGRAGKFGDALNFYAQGLAAMNDVAWNADLEFAFSLRGTLSHAMVDQAKGGKLTLRLQPLYATAHAAEAKVSATVVLVQGGKEIGVLADKAAVDPAHVPFTEELAIPSDATGDYTIEVRLAEADGSAPASLRTGLVKPLALHVEDLSSDAARLRAALAKAPKGSPALPSAEQALALYEQADKGEVNPRAYHFKKEFATAQQIVDAVQAGKDPFAGKQGDFHRAYRSQTDQTLQPYRLMIPPSYDGAKAVPLLVALHGMGGDENSMFDSYGKELPADAAKAGFILAAPRGREPASMYRGSAEQDVLDVIAEVERDYHVDKSRVYLMGHSMGGFGTWSIAMNHPELFAALGPISGGGDASGMAKLRDIPQYVTHGDNDKTVNVSSSRTMVEAGKKAGAKIEYVEVPGGSHVGVAQPAFAPMIEFFKKQAR